MIDLVLDVLVKSIFQFLISSNEELDGLTGTFLNNALSGGIEIGKEKIPAYLNSINRRVREEIRYSLERHCRGEAERERIILEFTELLRTVSSMPLSERPAFFDRDSLHKSLMKLYEKNSSQVSDEENAVFSGVLYDLAPLLIREQAKLKGYAYELVLECFKHVLQIQAGTKDISLRLERMERLLEEERLQPELPVQTFYRLWGQSVKAEFGNPESRLEKHRNLLSFLDDRLTKEMFDELCLDLPETSGGRRTAAGTVYVCRKQLAASALLCADACVVCKSLDGTIWRGAARCRSVLQKAFTHSRKPADREAPESGGSIDKNRTGRQSGISE